MSAKKKALISVSDKSNLEGLLEVLESAGYSFISTGGTAKFIIEAGYKVKEVSSLTNFPEMLGGRVKTLHPKVLGGILARRDQASDLKELDEQNIETIDLVVVNLYPFKNVIKKDNLVFMDAIENIDIGGPTLLRSAAKNYQSITVLSQPSQYQEFIEIFTGYGDDSFEMQALRERLAIIVFADCSDYDKAIASFLDVKLRGTPIGANYQLTDDTDGKPGSQIPESFNLSLDLQASLRYGENPHQNAGLYINKAEPKSGLANYKQLNGKELSFNNLLDLDSAWAIVSEYEPEIPCVAIIKHNNPCGVAIAPSAGQAFIDALSCDTVSAFGGIVASNVPVDLAAANEMSQIFLELIVAPGFTREALDVLRIKKNLRLIEMSLDKPKPSWDIKKVSGAYLIQDENKFLLNREDVKVVTEKEVLETQWVDLLLAWKVVKHCKSNAIVAVKEGRTLGIGCGQTNRVKAVEDALRNFDLDTRGAVLASDAFFPFADNIKLAAQNYISAIIQPGGSIKDQEVIDACNEAGIAMVFTKTRHFRH
jgi:phosphoribosylaminoimidazolecarboxamide formyltransferase / IMP cyclohydrolase